VELAVDIAHDLDRRLELEQRWLVHADRCRLVDQPGYLVRRQVDCAARLLCERREQAGRRRQLTEMSAGAQRGTRGLMAGELKCPDPVWV
jgi:hypothetical protein